MVSDEERAEKLLQESKEQRRHTRRVTETNSYLDEAIDDLDPSIDLDSDDLKRLAVALGVEQLDKMDDDTIRDEIKKRDF